MYNQTAREPDSFWLRGPQVSKELIDVRKYLLVGDEIDDTDCDEGTEWGLGEGVGGCLGLGVLAEDSSSPGKKRVDSFAASGSSMRLALTLGIE